MTLPSQTLEWASDTQTNTLFETSRGLQCQKFHTTKYKQTCLLAKPFTNLIQNISDGGL